MTSQSGATGEIALRLAEIAISAGSARERDAAIMRLLRERLGPTFIAVYKVQSRAGALATLRTRANDARVSHIHPTLTRAARAAASVWLSSGTATPCVLDDPRFGGWQVAGCLPGGARAGLAVVAVWSPDGDATAGARILDELGPLLLLAIGRGATRVHLQASSDDATTDAAKAEFVSLVSHSIRTPLNTLTGFIEIVLDQPVGPLNERQREFLEYARTSGQALTQLVEDVMLLSRADEGSLALRYEPLDADEIARRALRVVETVAHARNVQISPQVGDESLILEADGERLAHALAKLLENAVKFSPAAGEVALTVTASNGMARFAVRDQGPGVAPEDAERIFARFYQAERSAKSYPGGYGLGLAVARVIARVHGGEIRVVSALEEGATFTLSIPIVATSKADQRTATKSRRGASGAASRPS